MINLRHKFLNAAVGACALLFGTGAMSATLTFDKITSNTTLDASSQLSVKVTDYDNVGTLGALFEIDALASGSVNNFTIGEVYWSDMGGLFTAPLIEIDSTGGIDAGGVQMSEGSASPANLPDGGNATPPFVGTSNLLADNTGQGNATGIDEGEFYNAFIGYAQGVTFADVIADLKNGDLRMAFHVRSHGDGQSDDLGSESYVGGGCVGVDCFPGTSPVPVPASLPLLLTALGFGAYMGKRKRRSA